MKYLKRLTQCLPVLAALIPGPAPGQGADAYPSRAVIVVVPFAPGGPVGYEARLFSNKVSEILGKPFVIDFRGGAGSTVGTSYVAKSAPNGYTLLVITTSFTVFPAFYKDLPFDTIRDFAPVSLMKKSPSVLLAHPSFAVKTFKEYVAYAKANPGKINIGNSGAGGIAHLAGGWLGNLLDIKVTHVHYKGAGPQLVDLVAGRIDASLLGLTAALQLMKAGKLRALAITDTQRSKLAPDIPTISETVPEFSYSNWTAFVAPQATPAPIINKLSEAFSRAAKSPEVMAPMDAEGSILIGSGPEQLRQLIATETARWKKIVEETNIKLEE